jgi:hypothetical protein
MSECPKFVVGDPHVLQTIIRYHERLKRGTGRQLTQLIELFHICKFSKKWRSTYQLQSPERCLTAEPLTLQQKRPCRMAEILADSCLARGFCRLHNKQQGSRSSDPVRSEKITLKGPGYDLNPNVKKCHDIRSCPLDEYSRKQKGLSLEAERTHIKSTLLGQLVDSGQQRPQIFHVRSCHHGQRKVLRRDCALILPVVVRKLQLRYLREVNDSRRKDMELNHDSRET